MIASLFFLQYSRRLLWFLRYSQHSYVNMMLCMSGWSNAFVSVLSGPLYVLGKPIIQYCNRRPSWITSDESHQQNGCEVRSHSVVAECWHT